jgi:hypothetical protein
MASPIRVMTAETGNPADRIGTVKGDHRRMKFVRHVAVFVIAFVVGSAVNMALILLGPSIVAPPAGVDVNNAASLAASIHLFEPRHFVMPFLAHAAGAFVGALVAYLLALRNEVRLAYAVGVAFLFGGLAASLMIPAPGWFIALDLLAAYLPMAWAAVRVGERIKRKP